MNRVRVDPPELTRAFSRSVGVTHAGDLLGKKGGSRNSGDEVVETMNRAT